MTHFPDVAADDLARLHHDLAARAAADDLLDVAYRTVDSPVGPLLLARTPVGLVRVAFGVQDHDAVLTALASTVSPRVLEAPGQYAGGAAANLVLLDLETRVGVAA
jgi:methylated-DNA-[protein]-cysteine S-methyltransferase